MDESVLLRRVGNSSVMRAQLERLVGMAEWPNIELRVLPLSQNIGLLAGSFVIMSFGSPGALETAALSDVVSTENLTTELYVEGEADTHLYRLFFQALATSALPPADSQVFIRSAMERVWS